jgi:hypothetical protein
VPVVSRHYRYIVPFLGRAEGHSIITRHFS